MVLVAYIPNTSVSILQTKFRNREGHEARRIGLEAMPLDQHMEGRHGKRQARLKPTGRRTAFPGGVDQRGYRVGWLRSQASVPRPHPLASGRGT